MVESGASDPVVSVENFESYPLRRQWHQAQRTHRQLETKQVETSWRYVRVVDEYGTESWAKFQMCKGLRQDKILGVSVGSRSQDIRWHSEVQSKEETFRTIPIDAERT